MKQVYFRGRDITVVEIALLTQLPQVRFSAFPRMRSFLISQILINDTAQRSGQRLNFFIETVYYKANLSLHYNKIFDRDVHRKYFYLYRDSIPRPSNQSLLAQHRGCILASHPAVQGSILGIPENLFFDVAEIYRRHRLEESGQRVEIVDWAHLILASGKLVLQKRFLSYLSI